MDDPLFDSDSDVADQQELNDLLAKARVSLAAARPPSDKSPRSSDELAKPPRRRPFLDPGPQLPAPYFNKTDTHSGVAPTLQRDPDVQQASNMASSSSAALKPPPRGPLMTKRERRESRKTNSGPEWFDLPAPRPHELPELYKQVEALRLRRAMDPKAHVRNDPGERKGIKGLPKYFAIGKIIDAPTPFKSRNSSNLTRKERKKTLVEELVADTQARDHAKRKFAELEASQRRGPPRKGGTNTTPSPSKRPKKW